MAARRRAGGPWRRTSRGQHALAGMLEIVWRWSIGGSGDALVRCSISNTYVVPRRREVLQWLALQGAEGLPGLEEFSNRGLQLARLPAGHGGFEGIRRQLCFES
jgi:hypothetical protein